MPLTEQERQEILARRQQPTPPASPTSTPGVLPPASAAQLPGLEVAGVTIGPRGPSIRYAPPKPPKEAPQPKPIPSGQLKVLQDTDKAIRRLQKLMATHQEKQFKTGPMSPRFYRGTVGNIAMQYSGTPEERQWKAENERFVNDYISAQTGAQRGFKEMQWLGTSIPNPSQDTPENYLVNAESALNDLIENRAQMLQRLRDSGYQTPTEDDADTVDPNILQLQQQFPGAKIRRKP